MKKLIVGMTICPKVQIFQKVHILRINMVTKKALQIAGKDSKYTNYTVDQVS